MIKRTTAIGFVAITILFAQERAELIDYPMISAIRDEGLSHSQVMDHVSWLSDVYGPRLTGSPGHRQAAEWAQKKFVELGRTFGIAH